MRAEEKELFFQLSRFRHTDPEKLHKCLEAGADTPAVLGELFFNRMASIAYDVLMQNNLVYQTNREFRTALQGAYVQNVQKNESYFICLDRLNDILRGCRGLYAMLKGAYLCRYYPDGYRTSNDVDLLVDARDVTKVGDALCDAGFRQGYIRNDRFVPAHRKEIIASKMMRGETVPYILPVNLPFLKFLEVDLNFSLSYTSSESDIVSSMIGSAQETKVRGMPILTLEPDDFLIHLCGHLYKEATTYPWVKMRRDMSLYKYCDLYLLLSNISESGMDRLARRIVGLGVNEPCYYAVWSTKQLFDMHAYPLDQLLMLIAPDDLSFIDRVVSPAEQKTYDYKEPDLLKRFWADDRTALLEECK